MITLRHRNVTPTVEQSQSRETGSRTAG